MQEYAMTAKQVARVTSVVAVVQEWQRGRYSWNQVQWLADLTDAEMERLGSRVNRPMTVESTRKAVEYAVNRPD
jgi:cell division inhibitor SulA